MTTGLFIIIFLLSSSIFITWFTAVAFCEKDYRKPILVLAMVLIISATFGILYAGYDTFSKIAINCHKTIGCNIGNIVFIKEIIEDYELEQAKLNIKEKLK